MSKRKGWKGQDELKDHVEQNMEETSEDVHSPERKTAEAKSDTAEILNYDASKLWNEYQEYPAWLTPKEWEFLGKSLDTLNIDEQAKRDFCVFRAENDAWLEEVTLTPQDAMRDFKILSNWYIYDKLNDEQLQNIITAIELDSLEESDYRKCIDMVKIRILKSKEANEDSELLVQLKNKLERDLAEKLIVRWRNDERLFELPFKDILFLDNHWNEYHNEHTHFNKVHLQIWENARSSANYVNITSKVASLFDKAGETLQKFIKLGNEKPEIFPEPFDPARTGGFITVSVWDQDATIPRDLVQTRQIGWWEILTQKDPEYGTRGDKYNFFSRRKDLFSILENKKDSGDTSFNGTGVKGRITFDIEHKIIWYPYPDKKIGLSYSGWTPLQDQAIVVIAAREAGVITDAELIDWQASSNNPYLTPEFLTALHSV